MGTTQNSPRSGAETSGSTVESQDGSRPAADGGTAVGADDTLLQEWVIFVGSMLTISGIGIGIFRILIDGISTEISETTGNTAVWGFTWTSSTAIIIAVFVGVFLAWHLEASRNPTKIAAASMLVGTFGLVVTRVGLRSSISDSSLAIGGLVINALVAALVAAGVAAAGVWLAQNRAPTGTAQRTATAAGVSGQTSD